MATATLETLEIEIKHSASGAADEINRVATAIRALNDSLKGIVPKLTKLAGALNAIKGGRRDLTFNISDNSLHQTADTITNITQKIPKAEKSVSTMSKAFSAVGAAAKKAIASVTGFIRSLGRIAFYRLIRSMLKAVSQAFSEGLKNAYLFSQGIEGQGHRFAEAMDQMKSATTKMKSELGAAFLGLLTAIMPLLLQLISLVTRAANAINQLIASFTGTTYLKARDVTDKWADNTERGARAAKEWRNQLLGFDEINRLDEPNNGGGGGSTGLDPSQLFEDAPIEDWVMRIHDSLAAIEMFAGGCLLALGLILTFSGANIPLGLGLIAAGALLLKDSLSENWNTIDPVIKHKLGNIMFYAGLAVLAIGLILALSGANIPLGIGMIAAGITMTFIGAALKWDWSPQTIKRIFADIASILAVGIAVTGILLCLTGAGIPIGIGMLYAAYKMAGYATSIDENGLTTKVKTICDKIWGFISGLFSWISDGIAAIIGDIQAAFEFLVGFIDAANQALTDFYNQPIWEGGRTYTADGDVDVWNGMNFATGGHPQVGELFIAREAGPEMVGTIGGQNTVATNADIVEGIKIGVFEAVSAAMNGNTSSQEVRVYLDSREIRAGQQRLARSMGV